MLGRDCRVKTLELMHEDRLLRAVPVRGHRRDMAVRFPDIAWAEHCGFTMDSGVLGLPREFELTLDAILEDGDRVSTATIRGTHEPLRSSHQPGLQPLMVTSLGRTGSTWLMQLVGAHPEIVFHPSHPYEIRAAAYWMHMLKVLSEPANHLQSADVGNFHANLFWVGHHPFHSPRTTAAPPLRQWFRETYPEQLAAFCQRNIDAFYSEVAGMQQKPNPRYFAEKFQPSYLQWLVWELYPQAREIVLVRDPRDMLCSILAFNAKRGYVAFRREQAESDEDYIRQLARQTSRFCERWQQRADKARLVKYEDLVTRPIETLTGILDYLGLESSPSMSAAMLASAAEETPESAHHRTSASATASIGRWRRDLDQALRPVCEAAFRDSLVALGYGDCEET